MKNNRKLKYIIGFYILTFFVTYVAANYMLNYDRTHPAKNQGDTSLIRLSSSGSLQWLLGPGSDSSSSRPHPPRAQPSCPLSQYHTPNVTAGQSLVLAPLGENHALCGFTSNP